VCRIEERCRELGIAPIANWNDAEEGLVPDESSPTDEDSIEVSEEDEPALVDMPPRLPQSDEPFSGYVENRSYPDPRDAATTNVRQALFEIIERDGPLSFPSIVRLYREGCPALGRAAKTVQSELRKALGVMKRMNQIEIENEFQDGSEDGRIYRIQGTPRVRERAAGLRRLEEIPPSEIMSVLSRLNGDIGNIDHCCRLILEHYNFHRLTAPRRAYLAKTVSEMLRSQGSVSSIPATSLFQL
jgi:hypothetical protein